MIAPENLYQRNREKQGTTILWKGSHKPGPTKKRKFQAEWLKPGVKSQTPDFKSGQKARLGVEVHSDPAMDENQEGHGPERRGNRRLASESTPVEQGQDFATSTGILDREEMSELSDISTENMATTRSPKDNTMTLGVTEKPTMSSLSSERVKKTFGNFPFTMGTGTGDEAEIQEEEDDNDGKGDFGSNVSLKSSTQENDAYTDREDGTMHQLGVVRTKSKATKRSGQSRDFVNMTNSEMRTSKKKTQGYLTHLRIQKWITKRR